ncbi:MAG: hypothetical protein ACPH93_03180, partial [Candidatus Poseidoniaceae archaeon]
MHGGAKWTLISGAALVVLGMLGMLIGGIAGSEMTEVDPTDDVVFSGTEGQITVTPFDYLNVFARGDS